MPEVTSALTADSAAVASDASEDRRRHALMASCAVLSALMFVWRQRFLPLQDFPDWITQGKLFADLLQGKLAAAYSFKASPVPNAISSVCIGLLSLAMNPEVAGKVVLSGYVIACSLAVSYLLTACGRENSSVYLAIGQVFVLNFSFFHGEINYAIALAVLYAGQGLVLRGESRSAASLTVHIALVSIVIYFCHGAGYAAWLMFLVAYVWETRSVSTAFRCSVALVPSLAIAAIYVASRTSERGAIVVGWQARAAVFAIGEKLWLIFKFLSPLQGFYPFLDSGWATFLIVGNVIAIAFALRGFALWWRSRSSREDLKLRVILTSLGLYVAAFVLAPHNIGGLFNPAERFVLPAFQLLLAAMAASPSAGVRASSRAPATAAWVLLAVQAVYLHGYAGLASQRLAAAEERLRPYAQASSLTVLHESHFSFQGHAHPSRPFAWWLLPMHYPMCHLTHYASLAAQRPVPIFETGLFRSALGHEHINAASLQQLSLREPVVIVGWVPGIRSIFGLMPRIPMRVDTDNRSFMVVDASR